MLPDIFAGNWIYRSFVNLTELLPELDPQNHSTADIERWSRYLFGQGVMIFHPSSSGAFQGVFRMGDANSPLDMDLLGKMEVRDGVTFLKWCARGIKNTPSDGWLYEYEACLNPTWINGSTAEAQKQVATIVGSVVRSQAHHDQAPNQSVDRSARAGVTGSFIMVREKFRHAREAIPLPDSVLKLVGSESYRLHHAIWHGLRDNWVTPSDGEISDAEKAVIASLKWDPPRANQRPVRGTAAVRDPDNGAGEDFLFMHRQMIAAVRGILTADGLGPIESWKSIPIPNRDSGNTDGFSVPPAWLEGQTERDAAALGQIKSDDYWLSRMSFLERQFKNPVYLASLTLDQLGGKIEWLIHNLMHIRWCSQPSDPESGLAIPSRPLTDRSGKWVKSQLAGKELYYDDLNDTFSSHVHPVFWRLHGWVDDRIDDWFNAHEAAHPGEVVRADVGGTPWFEKGKWVAVDDPWVGSLDVAHGHGHSHGHGHDHDAQDDIVATMRKIYDLIFVEAAPLVVKARSASLVLKASTL